MAIAAPEARLGRFWGKADRRHIDLIADRVRGPRVLDLGCGYGSFTDAANHRPGLECIGVDVSERDLEAARRLHPGSEYVLADAESLPFDDSSFDTIVLRDTIHHLLNESEWDRVAAELERVSAPGARLIVFDPNVQPLLRLARTAISHDDEECSFEDALDLVRGLGFTITSASFHTFFTLPLSGGYVGPELMPDWPWLQRAVLRLDERLEDALGRRRFGRQTAWRYLIVADKAG